MDKSLNHSFTKDHRLLCAADFKPIFDKADIKASHPQFLVLAKIAPISQTYPRLGIIVAKKNVKLAVNRNKIKRLIRESFRTKQAHFIRIDAIVLARKGIDNQSNQQVTAILDQLWKKIVKKAITVEKDTRKKLAIKEQSDNTTKEKTKLKAHNKLQTSI